MPTVAEETFVTGTLHQQFDSLEGNRAQRISCQTDLALPCDRALVDGQTPIGTWRDGPVIELAGHLLLIGRLLKEADFIVHRAGHMLLDEGQGHIQVQPFLGQALGGCCCFGTFQLRQIGGGSGKLLPVLKGTQGYHCICRRQSCRMNTDEAAYT